MTERAKRRASSVRILIISSSYPFDADDFHALFAHEMAVALVETGARVQVITPAAGPGLTGVANQDGVEIIRFGYPGLSLSFLRLTGNDGIWQNIRQNPWRLLAVPGFMLAFCWAVIQARRRFRPNWAASHWLIPAGVAASLGFCFSRTRILHLGHGSDVHLLTRLPGRSMIAWFLARKGAIVATSGFIEKKIAPLLKREKIPVVALGVRGHSKPKKKTDLSTIRLCYMGRIVRGKGLYRALGFLRDRSGWSLAIAGEGSEKKNLMEEVRKHKLPVQFHSAVLGPAKKSFLQNAHFFLFIPRPAPERDFQDNAPVSVFEALRHGLPVVATRLHGLKSMFDEDELIFIDERPRSIAEAIEQIDEQTHARLARTAYQTGLRFSWDVAVADLIRLWRMK